MNRISIAKLALAYERINYEPVLTAMIERFFGGYIPAPTVHFRQLHREHPARVIRFHGEADWVIQLDSFGLAEWLGPFGWPITAVLAHELAHIFRIDVEQLRGRHGRGFDLLCAEISSSGCPVTSSDGTLFTGQVQQPHFWRGQTALARRTPAQIVVKVAA